MASLAVVIAVPLMSAPATANNNFMGALKGSPPMSPPFINSPNSYDISSQPATVVFTTKVENVTNHEVTVTLDIDVHHVMTYYGRNVADGEPGQAGITFKRGDWRHTHDEPYGSERDRTITIEPNGTRMVTFDTVVTKCGYFQVDIGKHFDNGSYENLSTGFVRVLGCKTSGGGGTPGGTGGVSGATAGIPLANTGAPIGGGLMGLILVLAGALGLRFRRLLTF
jgi:hypothetical protein